MLVRNVNALGQLILDRRRTLGWSQTHLAELIGASRYWVAQVEKGKATAEVGLVVNAIRALGLVIDIRSAADIDLPAVQGVEGGWASPRSRSRTALTRKGKPLRPSKATGRSRRGSES